MVRVVFLGVGGWISEPFLGFTSILIESRGRAVLVDAGEGVYEALRRCGYDIDVIEAVVLTHSHGDHVLGLPTLLLMSVHKGLGTLRVVSIPRVFNSIKLLLKAVEMERLVNNIEFVEVLPPPIVHVANFRLSFIEALHTVPAISVRIDVDGKCIAFSGDTRYNPGFADFAKNCNVLIHEASDHSRNAYLYGHSSYGEALEIAFKANAEVFVPIHFYERPKPIEIGYTDHGKRLKIYVPIPCTCLEV